MDDALRQELSRFRDRASGSVAQGRSVDELTEALARLLEASPQIPSNVAPHIVVSAMVHDIVLSNGDTDEATKLLTSYRRS